VSKGEYSHGAHVDNVIKQSKAKHGSRTILLEACRRADYGKPFSTFTKKQLHETTGLCDKTIREALRFLRAEGTLVPTQGFAGGKGVAVTYRLVAVGQGAQVTTSRTDRAGAVRAMRSRIMAENPRLTFGEAQAMAEKEAG
jgi:hypothetical protein